MLVVRGGVEPPTFRFSVAYDGCQPVVLKGAQGR